MWTGFGEHTSHCTARVSCASLTSHAQSCVVEDTETRALLVCIRLLKTIASGMAATSPQFHVGGHSATGHAAHSEARVRTARSVRTHTARSGCSTLQRSARLLISRGSHQCGAANPQAVVGDLNTRVVAGSAAGAGFDSARSSSSIMSNTTTSLMRSRAALQDQLYLVSRRLDRCMERRKDKEKLRGLIPLAQNAAERDYNDKVQNMCVTAGYVAPFVHIRLH